MLDKLEVFAVDVREQLELGIETTPFILCVKLTDKWCKPLRDIGKNFDEVMSDSNKSIVSALMVFDVETDFKVDMLFDPNEMLDEFLQRKLEDFLVKHNEEEKVCHQ